MTYRLLKSAFLIAAALAVTMDKSPITLAKDEHHPVRRVVLNGVITAVAETETGQVLTIDLDEVDDDIADDVTVQLTAETRVSPPGAAPAVNVKARAVAIAPLGEDGAYTALVLVLKGRPQPEKRPLQGCGTISALPDGSTQGDWTISVAEIADYQFTVNERTRISPPGVEPALDMRACFLARSSAAGWVAEHVQLKPERDGSGEDARVGLNGIITGLPAVLPVTGWTLTIETEGGVQFDVLVTPDTEIEGSLALGARVAIRAISATDDAGVETLTAVKIKVVGRPDVPGVGHARAAVRVSGVVSVVSEDGSSWTITHNETDVVVMIAADTQIVGLAPGESALDLEVHGVAFTQSDGSLMARLLRVKRH